MRARSRAFPGARRALAWLPAAAALCLAAGCIFDGKGGGTQTEVRGRSVTEDGGPVAFARVQVRPSDYLSDLISTPSTDPRIRDTVTDAQGNFALANLPAGEYRLEIIGGGSHGSIHDFFLPESGKPLTLAPDTVRLTGGISGSIAPDSDSQADVLFQIYGMERNPVKVDLQGAFSQYGLPPGTYDVRLSSQEPFRRGKILHEVEVVEGRQTPLDPVALDREPKLSIHIGPNGLEILGLDSTNPVIFDNERWDNGPDNEYVWAKASTGALKLRGTIVTRDFHTGTAMDTQLKKARQELRDARMAGFANLPDMTLGATAKLSWPASGVLEDIPKAPSAGSELIVEEAKNATPEKPLLVVVGGPLTTVAQAWLTDPSIASRMIVIGVYSYRMHPEDTVANYLVARKCRFLQWGRDYVWGGATDTSRISSIPPTLMGERLRSYLYANTLALPYGDLAPVAYLFRPYAWSRAKMVKVSRNLEVREASDITFDFVDIPLEGNRFYEYQDQFFAALSDPAAYHPIALPGRVESGAFVAMSKVTPVIQDSSLGSDGGNYADGGYTEHKITSAGGALKLVARYRSPAGAKLVFSADKGQPLGELVLPPAESWSEAVLPSLALEAGDHVLKVTASGGSAALDWLDFLAP